MPVKRSSRLYWRTQGSVRRAYGDFRDLGGKQEALIPHGQRQATSEPDVAQALISARVKELEAHRRGIALIGEQKSATLAYYSAQHLIKKKQSGQTTDKELEKIKQRLQNAAAFMSKRKRVPDPELSSINVEDVQEWMSHLFVTLASKPRKKAAAEQEREKKPASPGTVRHYLMSLSNLYRRAEGEGYVTSGYNPVRSLMDKPQVTRSEAEWLEVHEAALFLEAARLYQPRQSNYLKCAYPLVATFILTGGRAREIMGLEISDLNFERKTVSFRPNKWRDLKTAKSHRTMRMWPQLETILREYLAGANAPTGKLLFPVMVDRREQMINDDRKLIATLTKLAGIERYITAHIFRHTYCAARLQTLDGGAPVSPFTVSHELGHGGFAMVDKVYGHLGEFRHRAEVVEYNVAQHSKQIAGSLKDLRRRAQAQQAA